MVNNNILQRLKTSFQNPTVRRNVSILMAGKMLGLVMLLLLVHLFFPSTAVHAQEDAALDPMLAINAINTTWTLLAAFLVFGMQVGFVMLEAGFSRSREAVNILVEGVADTFICGLTFWAFGYAFMFGAGTPF